MSPSSVSPRPLFGDRDFLLHQVPSTTQKNGFRIWILHIGAQFDDKAAASSIQIMFVGTSSST